MSNKNLKKNLIYNFVGNFTYLAIQWVLTVIVVKFSNYEDAGVLALCIGISAIIYCISTFSIRSFQSSDLNSRFSANEYISLRIITSVISIIVCIIFLLFSGYNLYTFSCILIYNLYKIVEGFCDVLHGELQKKWRLDIAGISFLIRGILTLISFSLVLYFCKSLLYALLSMMILSVIQFYFYDCKKYMVIIGKKEKSNLAKVKKIFIICLPLAIYGLLSNVLLFLPKYILERVYTSEILGIYSSLSAPIAIVQVSANLILAPFCTLIAENFEKKNVNYVPKLIKKIDIFTIFILIFGSIFIYFLGEYALTILYTASILKYAYLLYPLLITGVLIAYTTFLSNILIVFRKLKSLMVLMIVTIVFGGIISYYLIINHMILGASIALIIPLLFQLIVARYIVFSCQKNR